MNATINNIILEGLKFRIFITISNGVDETTLFEYDATSQTIRDWVASRVLFHEELKQRELELQGELIGLEL